MYSYLRVVAIDVALIVATHGYLCIVLIPNAQFWYKEYRGVPIKEFWSLLIATDSICCCSISTP